MVNKKPSRTRKAGLRDPSLIVIAAEGVNTEIAYFRGIEEKTRDSRLKIKVLERGESGKSAPKYVFEELKKYAKESGIGQHDELCMVIDRDSNSTSEEALSEVAQHCSQSNYLLAVSNPSFELWLYLHFKCALALSEEERTTMLAFVGREFKPLISNLCPNGYNSSNLQIDSFWANVEIAIERAKRLDDNSEDRWPTNLGTRVYVLIEKILKKFHQTS